MSKSQDKKKKDKKKPAKTMKEKRKDKKAKKNNKENPGLLNSDWPTTAPKSAVRRQVSEPGFRYL